MVVQTARHKARGMRVASSEPPAQRAELTAGRCAEHSGRADPGGGQGELAAKINVIVIVLNHALPTPTRNTARGAVSAASALVARARGDGMGSSAQAA